MACYGVIADIHGNREALVALLARLEDWGVRRIACLGDIVGYNADPDECVALVRSRCAPPVIAGNHDLISIGRLGFSRCANNAAYALKRTRRTLAPQSAEFLASLPATHVLEESVVLVHGGVRDVQQYMTTPAHVRQNAEMLRADFPGARVCFFGHSHEQKVYEVGGDEVRELPAQGKLSLDRGLLYFINPGSVDASRKRRYKAAECALFDTLDWSVEFVRTRYDSATSEAKAAAFGYRMSPLADRLYSLRRRVLRRMGFA
jgi:predicted phosphodiesterase